MSLHSSSTLFLREVSEKKLRKLVQLAHSDPIPLIDATEDGFFNIIKSKARGILKIECGRARTDTLRTYFQRAINILEDKI